MVLRINEEIIDLIKNGEFDEDTEKILLQCIMLEGKRYKTNYPRFTEEYDKIIESFVGYI
jgi:hypothetical protein